jgi:hypothetical protein
MAVTINRLHSIRGLTLIDALIADGFSHIRRRRGDGIMCATDSRGRRVEATLPSLRDQVSPDTLKSVFRQAAWTENDLKRLSLIR